MTAEERENQSICSLAGVKYSGAFHLGNRGTICNPLLSVLLVLARLRPEIDGSRRSSKKYSASSDYETLNV